MFLKKQQSGRKFPAVNSRFYSCFTSKRTFYIVNFLFSVLQLLFFRDDYPLKQPLKLLFLLRVIVNPPPPNTWGGKHLVNHDSELPIVVF